MQLLALFNIDWYVWVGLVAFAFIWWFAWWLGTLHRDGRARRLGFYWPALATFTLVLLVLFIAVPIPRSWAALAFALPVFLLISALVAAISWPALQYFRAMAARTRVQPRTSPETPARESAPRPRRYGPIMRALTGVDAPPPGGLFTDPRAAARRDAERRPGSR